MNRPSCFGMTSAQSADYRARTCINCPYILDCVIREEFIGSVRARPVGKPAGTAGGKKASSSDHLLAVSKGEIPPDVGTKHDNGKPRWSLVPAGVMRDVIAVLEFGARRYAVNNWMRIDDPGTRYYDAAMRHIDAWRGGERVDGDSGLPHLAHAICCLMFLMWFESWGKY